MSRIPKIGFGSSTGSRGLQENMPEPPVKKTSSSNLMSGFKRPSDDNLCAAGKRHKADLNTAGKKNGFQAPERFATKRVALQPIPDTGIRCSMPAIVSSTKLKIPGKPKRPAWDLKGRIQDMEENFQATQQRNANLKQELDIYNQRIAALESANSLLHKDVEIKSVQSVEASSQINKLESQMRCKTEENEALLKENELLNHDLTSLRSDYDNLKNTYQQETSALKSSITSLTCMKSGMQARLDALEIMVENQTREIEEMKRMGSEKDSRIEFLESKRREDESLRRKLHNTVLELKGNIRVFCRLRPPLSEEQKSGMIPASIVPVSGKAIEIQQLSDIGLNESGGKMQPKHEFAFDCYFSPSTSQENVFDEISQLVQSVLDGYNVCIFAYGQTGSGKTFTMEGPANIVDFVANKDNPNLGMIPRSVQQIFTTIADLESKGWKYKVEALFLEIYNERIQDLLNSQPGNGKCEIIKSGSKGTDCIISNVAPSEVTSAEHVYELMKKARINRAVAETKCNEYSSRSHYVFQMKIYGENTITGEKSDGTLNLVDLAGSERVKESESAGDRLTEAKAINKSLLNLGKVIMCLSRKESHIPYRDSKLTHLLANSIGGNSKTLMFVNISPDNKNLSETINSLRFATKVNQCNIGTAQKRIK